jgi:hypothetical protein
MDGTRPARTFFPGWDFPQRRFGGFPRVVETGYPEIESSSPPVRGIAFAERDRIPFFT